MTSGRPKPSSFAVYLKSAFDTGFATGICLVIAVAAKSLVAWIYLDLEGDKSLFLLFAQSFLNTGVFAEPFRDAGSGSLFYLYNPAVVTPLYSLLGAPLLFVTKSYVATDFFLTIFGWALLFTALFRLALRLFEKRWFANIFVLLTAFYLYPHEMESTPKDTLAAAFSLWAILLMLIFLQRPPRLLNTFCLTLSVACIFLVKLTYAPVALTLVFLLFFYVLLKKSREHALHFLLFGGLLVLVGLVAYRFVYLPAHRLSDPLTDSLATDDIPLVRGFYPQNLRYTFPFISSSLFNINFWGVQVEQKIRVPFEQVMNVFRLIDGIAMVGLLTSLVYYFRKFFASRLHLLLVAVSVAAVGSLFCMSMAYALTRPDKHAPNLWTYVAEARFYFLPVLVLQLFLFRFALMARRFIYVRLIVLALVVFEAAHGLYFDAKQTMNLTTAKNELQNKSPVKKATALARQWARNKSNDGLVTSNNFLRRYANLNNLQTYGIVQAPVDVSWAKKGSRIVVATHLQDTALRHGIRGLKLLKTDTVSPFVIQHAEKP